jgi:hypothetical protein
VSNVPAIYGIFCSPRLSVETHTFWLTFRRRLYVEVNRKLRRSVVIESFIFNKIINTFSTLDVRGSVHHSTILTVKNPNKMQQCIKILLFLILNKTQHDSGDTPPIIRSLKLHKQPLVLHDTVEGCWTCSCWTLSGSVRYLKTSTNCTSENLPRMPNQRLPVQF